MGRTVRISNQTEPNSNSARKKIEPNYQAPFTVRKSNLKIFVEPDLLATIVRKPNICTILQKLFLKKKIDNDYLEIIRLLTIECDNL
jgi:hypothetical protein